MPDLKTITYTFAGGAVNISATGKEEGDRLLEATGNLTQGTGYNVTVGACTHKTLGALTGIAVVNNPSALLASPAELPGLLFWYTAESIKGLSNDGQPVTFWPDLSANERDLSYDDGGAVPPTYIKNAKSGYPGVKWVNNTSQGLRQRGAILPIPMTLIAVVQNVSTTNGRILAGSPDPQRILFQANTLAWRIYAGANLGGPTVTAGQWIILNAVSNGANSLIRGNMGADTAGNDGTNVPTTISHLVGGDTVLANTLDGIVMEFIGYNRVLSLAERNAVDLYLNRKYVVF